MRFKRVRIFCNLRIEYELQILTYTITLKIIEIEKLRPLL